MGFLSIQKGVYKSADIIEKLPLRFAQYFNDGLWRQQYNATYNVPNLDTQRKAIHLVPLV